MDSHFVHLHLHSNHSLHRGCSSIEEIAARASGAGMEAIGLTDINNLYGAVDFYETCTEQGIRPVIGTELEKDGRSLLMYAADDAGYRFMCRAITSRLCEPGLSLEEIISRNLPQGIYAAGFDRQILNTVLQFIPAHQVFAGLRPQDTRSISRMNFVREAAAMGIQPLACADMYIPSPDTDSLYRTLRAIGKNTAVEHIEIPRSCRDCSFFDEQKARELFSEFPESVSNTLRVARSCSFEFDFSKTVFPECDIPEGETAFSWLHTICQEQLGKYYSPVTPEAVSRLAHELSVIEQTGFSEYFLIVREIMSYARHHSIPTTARGSGAASLITYLLGISDVDPIQYNLQFERFLNAYRTDCPDLDIDICWRRRDELIEHVYETYGHERTAMISTHNGYHPRSSFRDAALAHGVSMDRVNFLSKRIHREEFPSATELLMMLPRSMSRPGDRELFDSVLEISRRMDGFPHHLSIHCGGVVIAPVRITDHVPLEPSSKGPLITQFEMRAIEKIGLVKIDLLGQRGLSTISETAARVKERTGTDIVLRDIPDRDTETAALLKTGKTIGCFQIESPGMRGLMEMLQTSDIPLLTAALALIRPGPASAGMKSTFVRRVRGFEKNTSPLRCLEETHGIMLYQEDIMRAVREAAGLSLDLGEKMRKAIEKRPDPEQMKKIADYFIRRAVKKGMGSETARGIWENIQQFSGYSFCKAHAAVYGACAYRAAWLKVHYPAEYMTAVMNNHTGMYPRSAYIEEARRIGVNILQPHVLKSDAEFTTEDDGLRVGLCEIHGLSSSVIRRIIAEREERPFRSPFDFFQRAVPPVPEAEALVLSGALDFWEINRPTLIWICRNRDAEPALPFPDEYCPDLPDYNEAEKMKYEYEYLGFTCSSHPLSYLRKQEGFPDAAVLSELEHHTGEEITAAGIGLTARSCRTKKKETMGFLTIEDETATAEVTLQPAKYPLFRPIIYSRGPLLVSGKVEERYGHLSIIAENIKALGV
ncbi:MAG: DNA polymerase III subunit alpha [Candidatus Moranbacteria bacterium]|nr:DNA polymerase III subunit alpha [Candidatus Moranbacteria bacterium]